MELTFNIIYTPGTVEYLRLFVFSLLKWSDCAFRLVANGCGRSELGQLDELSRQDSRLTFVKLPWGTIKPHGEALNFLLSIEQADSFCFMDSDILATGAFMSELAPHIEESSGVFSGRPLWITQEEQLLPEEFGFMAGIHNRTANGLILGSSYFAIYDRPALARALQSTGVDFRQYRWLDLPAEARNQLQRMGLRKQLYDTGKVLSIMLQAQGGRLRHVESVSLHHIGGISTRTVTEKRIRPATRWRSRIQRLPSRKLRQRLMRIAGTRDFLLQDMTLTDAELSAIRHKRAKKQVVCRYFGRILQALFEDTPLPPKPSFEDAEIEVGVENVTQHIVRLYEEFGDRLRNT